ncbi:MAG: nickel/cobalt transporter [Planctomycetota bacterium]|jgi:nickel/cobalt exporter
MKWTLLTLMFLAAGSLHAHPFDDRAELISSIVMYQDGQTEKLRLEIQFAYEGVYSSINEITQFLDINGDGFVTKREAADRLDTLSNDLIAAATLKIDGNMATLLPQPLRFRLANIKNPDVSIDDPNGLSTDNLQIGYYLEYEVQLQQELGVGKHRVEFFYASVKAAISEPMEQLRVFDARGERTLAIMDAYYNRTRENYHKVAFNWEVGGETYVQPPVNPEPDKTGDEKLRETAKERAKGEQNDESIIAEWVKELRESDPFSWAWLSVLGALFLFGAYHAVQPGHGKTLVASYLIGTQGKPIDALFLGIVVTAAHTSGVFALMTGAWLANTYWPGMFENPEKQLAEWIALVVGATIFGMGFVLVMKRTSGGHHEHDIFGRHVDGHSHDHDHTHSHDGNTHTHTHDGHTHSHDHEVDPAKLSRFEILRLGVLGGVVPCPAGFVIGLLFFTGREYGMGLLAVTMFSLGLGAVLTAIGLMLVHSKEYLHKKQRETKSRWLQFAEAKLPTFGAMVIAMIGLVMTVFAAIRLGFLDPASFTV